MIDSDFVRISSGYFFWILIVRILASPVSNVQAGKSPHEIIDPQEASAGHIYVICIMWHGSDLCIYRCNWYVNETWLKCQFIEIPSGKRTNITMERSTMLFMGKSTMAILHSYFDITRGYLRGMGNGWPCRNSEILRQLMAIIPKSQWLIDGLKKWQIDG